MRAHAVVLYAPALESALLRVQRRRGRSCGLCLQHLVHLLVVGIVAGAAGPAMFHLDAQLYPPDIQGAPAKRSFSAEWRAVVGADRSRQAIPFE